MLNKNCCKIFLPKYLINDQFFIPNFEISKNLTDYSKRKY